MLLSYIETYVIALCLRRLSMHVYLKIMNIPYVDSVLSRNDFKN